MHGFGGMIIGCRTSNEKNEFRSLSLLSTPATQIRFNFFQSGLNFLRGQFIAHNSLWSSKIDSC